MKKIILFFSLQLMVITSYAQVYEPMVADSTLWKISIPNDMAIYGYLTSGTEQFQGKTYSKLYRIQFMGSFSQQAINQATNINQIGLLREENRQVFLVPTVSSICACAQGQETLIYDFNATVGDTVYTGLRNPISTESYFIVSNIDTLNGVIQQEVLIPSVDSNMSSQFPNQHQRERIKVGVGATREPFSCLTGTALFADRNLLTFIRGADIANHYFAVGLDMVEKARRWFAYPNPVGERLYISGIEALPFPLQFQIFDALGKKVHSSSWHINDLNQGLEVADLPAGLYFLQLSKDGQLLASEKIIKQ